MNLSGMKLRGDSQIEGLLWRADMPLRAFNPFGRRMPDIVIFSLISYASDTDAVTSIRIDSFRQAVIYGMSLKSSKFNLSIKLS